MTDTTPTPPAEPTPPAYAQSAAPGPKTNVLAIISLIAGIVGASIVAVILGHIALSQIKKRAEGGNVLAIIGLVLGYLGCLGWIIFWIIWIALLASGAATYSYYG